MIFCDSLGIIFHIKLTSESEVEWKIFAFRSINTNALFSSIPVVMYPESTPFLNASNVIGCFTMSE